MRLQLDGLERHGELVDGHDRYGPAVRAELLSMSAATIDRYLQTAKAKDQISGVSTTKPSVLLRNSITVRKAGDEVEAESGFFEGDTVAHCGPTLKGEFARTLNLIDVHTGWVFTRTMRNNAHTDVLTALRKAVSEIPYAVTGLDFDNGTEFLNEPVITWAGNKGIYFTRSRPYKKNDNAWVEQKNWTHVRKVVGYRRFDNTTELRLLNEIYAVLRLYKNFFLPTIKLASKTRVKGRIKRTYDQPCTPYHRVLESPQIQRKIKQQLKTLYDALNPAELQRRLQHLRNQLEQVSAGKSDIVQKRRWRGPDITLDNERGPTDVLSRYGTA